MAAAKVTKNSIRLLIERAEEEYGACWAYLPGRGTTEKTTRDVGAEQIVRFQPRLATMLFELTRTYRMIHREKEALISRKAAYSDAWFRRQTKFLASQQELLNMAISIGKGLGDAFACLFYHHDREFLAEHLTKQPVFHSSPGVGGSVELEFAKNVPLIGGYFLLHHCTTNILRLGDISLIDRKTGRVAGLGEIKAGQPESGAVRVTVHLSGPALLHPDGARIIKQSGPVLSVDQYNGRYENKLFVDYEWVAHDRTLVKSLVVAPGTNQT